MNEKDQIIEKGKAKVVFEWLLSWTTSAVIFDSEGHIIADVHPGKTTLSTVKTKDGNYALRESEQVASRMSTIHALRDAMKWINNKYTYKWTAEELAEELKVKADD